MWPGKIKVQHEDDVQDGVPECAQVEKIGVRI